MVATIDKRQTWAKEVPWSVHLLLEDCYWIYRHC
jgi:hypothetical protein